MKIKEIPFTAFDDDHSIAEIHIAELIPNVMGNVTIWEKEGEHIVSIPPDMDVMKWRKWILTNAGVFSKDFLAWMRDKRNPKYMIAKSEQYKTVVRLIDEEELLEFESRKLVNGKIKDTYYMHLKTVNNGQNIHGHERYIKENNVNPDDINEKETDKNELNDSYSEPLFN